MQDYNYTIPETVKFITNDVFPVYNDYYSDDLIIPETIKVFGAYFIPASGKYESNFISSDANIAVINNKCYLSPDTVISGYYGTEAHNYALAHNIRFSPLDDLIYGDANNDGDINIADAVLLQSYLLCNAETSWSADINKDGIINAFDMVYMRQKILNHQ